MARITSPNPGYNGTGPGDLVFRDGVTETDDPALLAYFERKGYGIDGSDPTRPEDPEPADPRDHTPEHVGARARDAAVDPRPEDFLPPTNAGRANPHGPDAVSPGIHAVHGPGPIVPGPVGDPEQQQNRETKAAQRVLVDQEPVPEVTADLGDGTQPVDEERPEPPAGNASADEWRAYAVEQHGADPEQVAGMKRADLIEQYGPKPE